MMSLAPGESYGRLGRRWRRSRAPRPRGFRLVCARNRFSVRRLRAKLLTILGFVGRYARLLVRRLSSSSSSTAGGSQLFPRSGGIARAGGLVVGEIGKDGGRGPQRWRRQQADQATATASKGPRRSASFMRTNSFYAQAVAECLEFIKRNSVPVEDRGASVAVVGAGR